MNLLQWDFFSLDTKRGRKPNIYPEGIYLTLLGTKMTITFVPKISPYLRNEKIYLIFCFHFPNQKFHNDFGIFNVS